MKQAEFNDALLRWGERECPARATVRRGRRGVNRGSSISFLIGLTCPGNFGPFMAWKG